MRIAPLAGQLFALISCLVLSAAPAWADGAQREAPIEPLDRPAAEEVVDPGAPEPEQEAEAPTPVAQVHRRHLTACEQLRLDIHGLQRNYYHQKRDDRRAAYIAMRNGDPAARYICIGTTCTHERSACLHATAMKWDHKSTELRQRIARGPLGSSDTCHIWHMSMMEQLFEGAKWHRMSWKQHGKHSGKGHQGDRRRASAEGEDRRDPFEIEMSSRYEKARRTRGY